MNEYHVKAIEAICFAIVLSVTMAACGGAFQKFSVCPTIQK